MLQGKNGVILHPSFLDVDTLADELTTVMVHEGYDIGVGRTGNVTLLPLEASNKLVVFVNDPAQLDHVEEWARILDTEHRDTLEEALFSYEVRNTQAEGTDRDAEQRARLGVADNDEPTRPRGARATGACPPSSRSAGSWSTRIAT